MEKENYSKLIRQLYLAQAALLGLKPDPIIVDLFVSEITKIDPSRVIPAMKQFIIENKFPSVSEVLALIGVKLEFGKEPERKLYEGENTEAENKKLYLEELSFRFEAPFPQIAQLEESAKYWKEAIRQKEKEGWILQVWDEYEGNKIYQEGENGRLKTDKQRVFYAVGQFSKNSKTFLVSKKNHFDEKGKVYAF